MSPLEYAYVPPSRSERSAISTSAPRPAALSAAASPAPPPPATRTSHCRSAISFAPSSGRRGLRREDVTANERKDLSTDPLGVPLLEIDADGVGADPDSVEAKFHDLLEPLGAVPRRANDREAVDQLVARRLARVEVELAW